MGVADLFKTAPKEVTRYFDGKASLPTFDWRDIAPEEHAFSFTVAKSAGYDILDDIRSAISEAITGKTPFEEFQRNLMPVLQQKGWWGKTLAIDPETGEEKLVQARLAAPPAHDLLGKHHVGACGGRMGADATEQGFPALPRLHPVHGRAETARA